MNTNNKKVACLGIVVADLVAQPVEVLPERGKLSTVQSMTLHTGGCAANTAIALSKMGAKTCIIGITGDDVLGKFLAGELHKHGIDTRGLKVRTGCSTSATMVMVHPDGERSFLHHIGANALLSSADVDLSLIGECAILHVAGALVMPGIDGTATAEILLAARLRGVVTSLDTAWDSTGRWLATLRPCLPHLDYFMPSLEEARQLSGLERPEDILQFFMDLGCSTVVLKMGESGAIAKSRHGTIGLPAIPSLTLDATGAGDCFAAGFLRGLLEGWELEQCLRLGNAAGALCVRAIGATTGISTFDETLALIAPS